MANVLSIDKQMAIISALAEGSSIRAIERMTGVHRDTIMRLGVRVGQGCAACWTQRCGTYPASTSSSMKYGDSSARKNATARDDAPRLATFGRSARLTPNQIGAVVQMWEARSATANAFVLDVASRMTNRVQISSDALRAYVDADRKAFGADVDFAQIIKTYVTDDSIFPSANSARRNLSSPKRSQSPDSRIWLWSPLATSND